MERNGHQRALNQLNKCFFAYFIRRTAFPALWLIVTEAIYDVRESYNCARTFDTDFRSDSLTYILPARGPLSSACSLAPRAESTRTRPELKNCSLKNISWKTELPKNDLYRPYRLQRQCWETKKVSP